MHQNILGAQLEDEDQALDDDPIGLEPPFDFLA
jgi:hypothetical protein